MANNLRGHIRVFIGKYFGWMPPALTRLFYKALKKIAEHRIKQLFSNKQYQIWTRNSFRFRRLSFFISDVDFTLILKQAMTESEIRLIAKKLKEKRFPLQGELNLYFEEDLRRVADVMNHYELQRDPELISYLENLGIKPNEKKNSANKAAFLIKMLQSDLFNLTLIPSLRIPKWQGHFNDLEFPKKITEQLVQLMQHNQNPIEFIIEQITKLLSLKNDDSIKFKQAMREWAHYTQLQKNWQDDDCDFIENSWRLVIGINQLTYTKKLLPQLSQDQISLAEAFVQWERFAYLTQRFNFENFDLHIEQIESLLSALRSQRL